MPIVIGTDEAGYGPNLGPLVVTATTWSIPDEMTPEEMWQSLDSALTDAPLRNDSRLHVSDSKKVYSAGKTIAPLERSVLAFLNYLKLPCLSDLELGTGVSGTGFRKDYKAASGKPSTDLALPLECQPDELAVASAMLSETMNERKVRLLAINSCIMFPKEFNRKVQAVNSKGKVLSSETMALVRLAVDNFLTNLPSASSDQGKLPNGWVICDKHGGRNRYDDVISEAFEDRFVFRIEEGGPRSVYRVGDLEFCFRTKAEALLPVALASMVSKYVREVTMMRFNAFWKQHLPELKPTKGYPLDAVRFWSDIEKTVERLGLSKSDLWRCR